VEERDGGRPLGQHRLIAVAGSSSGAGKSTGSAPRAERLGARLLTEDDLLGDGLFGAFDRALGDNADAVEPLLDAARALVGVVAASSQRWVTDALLPGAFWLAGRYDRERVTAAAARLAEVLAPTAPLLVYLAGDAEALFARAVAQRGAAWPDRVVGWTGRWPLPYYPGPPVIDVPSLVRLYAWLDAETRAVLAAWPLPTVVLDARQPVDALVARVLETG